MRLRAANEAYHRLELYLGPAGRAPDLAPQRERPPELDTDGEPRVRAPARVQHQARDAVDAEPWAVAVIPIALLPSGRDRGTANSVLGCPIALEQTDHCGRLGVVERGLAPSIPRHDTRSMTNQDFGGSYVVVLRRDVQRRLACGVYR